MYLLDTHTLLWFLNDSPKLSKRALEIITTEGKIFFSIVSLWEIAIKKTIGKLDLDSSISEIEALCYEKDISLIQIKAKHLDKIIELPITKDINIPHYPVKTVW